MQLSLTNAILASLRRKSITEVGSVSDSPSDRCRMRVLNDSQQDPRCSMIMTRIIWGKGFLCECTLQNQAQNWQSDVMEENVSHFCQYLNYSVWVLPVCLVLLNSFNVFSGVNLAEVVYDRLSVCLGKKNKSSSLVNQEWRCRGNLYKLRQPSMAAKHTLSWIIWGLNSP